jgi:hypothetical protein
MPTRTLRALPPPVEQVERDVLTDAVADMDRWIERLPAESSWRWTFMAARRELAKDLETQASGPGA